MPKSGDVEEHEVEEGSYLTLPCAPTKSIPPPSFSWTLKTQIKGGKPEKLKTSPRITIAADGSLHFTQVGKKFMF